MISSRFLLVIGLLIASGSAFATEVILYINKGAIEMDEQSFSACAFNASEDLEAKNLIITLTPNEPHIFYITNNDSLIHDFTIPGILESNNQLDPFETAIFEVTFDDEGVETYYSSPSYGRFCGAFGIIHIEEDPITSFYWNLFDLNKNNSTAFSNTSLENYPELYAPELFLINGSFYPFTLEDDDTLVSLNLGETCSIVVANGGYMDHVLHFHGFHVTIVDQTGEGNMIGWSKDTMPIKAGEAMILELTANLAGVYPVHDHNLIAVTNAGFYPGGMLTQIHVAE